jgi:hypothetical protein
LEPLNSSVFGFLRPQVQECRGVLNLARSMRSCPLSCDDSLPFEAGEYTVRQAGGHRRSFGKVHNGPAALRVKKEGLGDEAGLASESSRRCRTSPMRRTIVPGFQMQEQTGEFDMHVPQSVDDTDPVVREQAPRLARSGLGDEHEGSVRAKMTGPRGELVSGRRVRVSFELDDDRVSCSRAVDHRIGLGVTDRLFEGDDLDPRHRSEDAESLAPVGSFDLH